MEHELNIIITVDPSKSIIDAPTTNRMYEKGHYSMAYGVGEYYCYTDDEEFDHCKTKDMSKQWLQKDSFSGKLYVTVIKGDPQEIGEMIKREADHFTSDEEINIIIK